MRLEGCEPNAIDQIQVMFKFDKQIKQGFVLPKAREVTMGDELVSVPHRLVRNRGSYPDLPIAKQEPTDPMKLWRERQVLFG